MSVLNTYRERLPLHGFATNDIQYGLRFYAIEELIKRKLVQHNARHSIGWLVYDLDSDSAVVDLQDRKCPIPNIIAVNPDNGHAHAFYGLGAPVHDYPGASDKAKRYLAAVDIALTELLGADPGYSKLISKNPIHDEWLTIVPRADLYDLEELADWLDLRKYTDRRRRLPDIGYGRNCTLFDNLRRWAYRERRSVQGYLSEEMFIEACRWRAASINADFTPPLPNSEVRSTAKSVARWVWRKMSAEGFAAWQRRMSAAGNAAKRRKSEELRARIIQTARECPDLAQADIAALCGVNQATVSRHLRHYAYPISDKSPNSGGTGGMDDR